MDDIRIQAPDGSVVQFPAGTADAVIKTVMAKSYPKPIAPMANRPSDAPGDNALAYIPGTDGMPSAPAGAKLSDAIPSMDTVNSYGRAAANGLTLGMADRIAAGMSSLTGVGGKSGDYGANLSSEQAKTDQFGKDAPVGSTVSNLAGSAVTPLGAYRLAGKGLSLGAKWLYGMGTGGAIGGVQGALSSKDLTDLPQTGKNLVQGGVVGAGVGGAIPVTGKLLGAAYNAIANRLTGSASGMSRESSRHLVEAITADGRTNVQSEVQRLGPDAMLADAGPAFLGKAQGASLNSDEGRSIMTSALRARNEGTNSRIMNDVSSALGPAEDPQTVVNAIKARRSEVDSKAYPAALGKSSEVDTNNLLAELGPMIGQSVGIEKKALTNLRGMLMTEKQVPRLDPNAGYHMTDAKGAPLFDSVPTPQTDPAILHKIKGEIDNVIQYDQPGLGIPAAALSRQQGALKGIRHSLNDTLETQVPGYAEANSKSSMLAKRGEAVDAGTQYLGSGKTTASPDRFAADFAARAPGEQIAFAKGSRGNIERILGTKANDLQALRGELQGEGGWNTAKLGTVHGQDATDSLVSSVDRNLKFRDTYNKVVENSQTAQRTAASNAMKEVPPGELPFFNPSSTLTGMASTGAKKAIVAAVNSMRPDPTKAYGEIARILSQQGSQRDETVQRLIDALTRKQGNAATAPIAGDRAALISAILGNAYVQNGPSRMREPL